MQGLIKQNKCFLVNVVTAEKKSKIKYNLKGEAFKVKKKNKVTMNNKT